MRWLTFTLAAKNWLKIETLYVSKGWWSRIIRRDRASESEKRERLRERRESE